MENREKFFRRFQDYFTRQQKHCVELAYTLAKDAHRPQRRQETGPDGKPLRYFEHPRRVALITLDECGIIDWELICIALLHDIVEDTRYIGVDFIRDFFGTRVADGVRLVTKMPKAGYEGRLTECSEWRALTVKTCDRLDNLRTLHHCSRDKISRKLGETVEWYYPIFQRMIDIAPANHKTVLTELASKVAKTVDQVRLKHLP